MSSASFASQTLVGEIGIVDEGLLRKQQELAALPEIRLRDEAIKALHYELDLPADERRRCVIGRLRAWLTLETRDARRIANAFADALEGLTPEERHTIRETEEDAVMDGLSYREFERLTGIVPSLQHWQDQIWTQLAPARSGVPGSFAAALALAGMTAGW
jgi:hypothetical protein